MDRLLNVMTLLSLALIVQVLTAVRRAHIRVEYSVAWLGAAVVLLVLSRSSRLLNWIASLIGIDQPPVALLLLVFVVFLVVFYRFSLRISDLKDANIELSQKIAILEFKLQSLHEDRNS